jgi:hypothetical protein
MVQHDSVFAALPAWTLISRPRLETLSMSSSSQVVPEPEPIAIVPADEPEEEEEYEEEEEEEAQQEEEYHGDTEGGAEDEDENPHNIDPNRYSIVYNLSRHIPPFFYHLAAPCQPNQSPLSISHNTAVAFYLLSTRLVSLSILRRAAVLGDLDQIRLAHRLGADMNDPDCGDDNDDNSDEEEEDEEDSKSKSGSKSGSKGGSKSGSGSGSESGAAKKKRLTIHLNTGDTALHLAAENGHVEVVGLLLDLMADIDRPNKIESTPLHRAVSYGKVEVTEFLIERKANVHALNKIGNTPMHCACFMQDLDTIKVLVEHGCREDLLAVNYVGVQAFDYAQLKLKSYLLQFMPQQFQDNYKREQEQNAQYDEDTQR